MDGFSEEEEAHYQRHLILDSFGAQSQKRLRDCRVLVVGAGGLGCPVLQYLTAAGIGTIGIVDDDRIERSNLQRQILYSTAAIGRLKVEQAVARLSLLNPLVHFDSYPQRLLPDGARDLVAAYDIIVDGTDNFPSRYLLNDACVLEGKPLVFGSIYKFQGQMSVFNYEQGPTYRCLYPDPPLPESLPNCSEAGVLGVLPGIIGSFQANEVLKIASGIGDVLSGELLCFDALSMQQQRIRFQKNTAIEIKEIAADYSAFCGLRTASELALAPIHMLSYSNYLQRRDRYTLLDVRSPAEFESYNQGGVHIPLRTLEARIDEIPTSKPILVCCQSGIRSQRAIQLLQEQGINQQFYNLKGGWNAQ